MEQVQFSVMQNFEKKELHMENNKGDETGDHPEQQQENIIKTASGIA